MNCCDDNGDCNQGRDCPVRTRRVRAGQPPADIDLWLEENDNREELSDIKAGVIVVALMLIVALFTAGWVSLL